jgi:hypothetical protein
MRLRSKPKLLSYGALADFRLLTWVAEGLLDTYAIAKTLQSNSYEQVNDGASGISIATYHSDASSFN